MKKYLTILLILSKFLVFGQTKFNINGTVKDSTNGEKIQGAYLKIDQQTVSSNSFGFFNIQSSKKSVLLTASAIGFKNKIIAFDLLADTTISLQLVPENYQLQEVVVTAEKLGNAQTEDALSGKFKLSASTIKKANIFIGESDVMKTLQLLPGVQSGTDGSSGVYVRGGSTDQNLILLDGIPVYNINHLFGFLSIFNTNAIANVNFLKGGIPASYGGRLSSVIDISLKEGNQKKTAINYSFGPILTNFSFETPLKKDRSSLLISFRKSLFDLLELTSVSENNKYLYGFYDGTIKLNYSLNNKDKLYFSFYSGKDNYYQLDQGNEFKYFWGNNTFGARWNRVISQKLFLNTLIYYSKFNYFLSQINKNQTVNNYYQRVNSGIEDLGIKLDFDFFASNFHQLKWGFQLISHGFSPEITVTKGADSLNQSNEIKKIQTVESNFYVESVFQLGAGISGNLGVFSSNFYSGGKVFYSLQPRINLKYTNQKGLSFYSFFNRNAQFLHLLTNSSLGLSTDLWVPANAQLGPENALVYGIGISKKINSKIIFSLESYFKDIKNVLEYKEGTQFFANSDHTWEDRVEKGNSKAYGLELYLESQSNPKTWISYSLSKTDRMFENLNNGKPFPFKFDRRHNLSINSTFSFKNGKSLSSTFVLNSGWASTVAAGRQGGKPLNFLSSKNYYEIIQVDYGWENLFNNLPDFQGRNSFRTPLYHRLDINYSSTIKKKKGTRTINFGFYNIYNQLNGYLFYQKNGKIYKNVLFPILPAFSYERSF